MSFTIQINLPDHDATITKVFQQDMTGAKLEQVIQRLCQVAEASLRESLAEHTRTGATAASIMSWPVAVSDATVAYQCGSLTRGAQLYWLDMGRREVRPVTSRFLHYFTWPEQIEVFSRYSRPTMPTGLMRRAALDALSQSSAIIEEIRLRG